MVDTPVTDKPRAENLDSAALFAVVEDRFRGAFALERIVAHTGERILFAARDLVLKRLVALRVQLRQGTRERAWFERETELLSVPASARAHRFRTAAEPVKPRSDQFAVIVAVLSPRLNMATV